MDDNIICYVIYFMYNEGRPLTKVLVILTPARYSGKLNV